jgi:hypothetical protein
LEGIPEKTSGGGEGPVRSTEEITRRSFHARRQLQTVVRPALK